MVCPSTSIGFPLASLRMRSLSVYRRHLMIKTLGAEGDWRGGPTRCARISSGGLAASLGNHFGMLALRQQHQALPPSCQEHQALSYHQANNTRLSPSIQQTTPGSLPPSSQQHQALSLHPSIQPTTPGSLLLFLLVFCCDHTYTTTHSSTAASVIGGVANKLGSSKDLLLVNLSLAVASQL
ncbi:uncharacterized protein LOC144458615 [Epinephelus lanceolatus]